MRLRNKNKGSKDFDPSVFEMLGVARCVIGVVVLGASLAVLLLGGPAWIAILGVVVVFVVLLTAALPGNSKNTYNKRRVKQSKAIRWF